MDDSDGSSDDESDVRHVPSEKSMGGDDRDTSLLHADVGLDRQRLDSVGGVVGVTRLLLPPCALGYTGGAAAGAQAVAGVAPGMTVVPAQGAMPATNRGGRVPVPFPPSRGCFSRLTRMPR